MSAKKSWYLLTTKPNQDQRAEDNLKNQGYLIYRPQVKIPKNIRGKRVNRLESLFPRYIFIQLDIEIDNWSPIRSTLGVSGFVRFGLHPAVVPNELISYLKANEDKLETQAVALEEFQLDEKIEVLGGIFKGYEGIFQKPDGKDRALVLLQFLGSQRTVKVPMALLKSIN